MNVEIGTEATLFPEKETINGIFLAVYTTRGPESYLKRSTSVSGFDSHVWPSVPPLTRVFLSCTTRGATFPHLHVLPEESLGLFWVVILNVLSNGMWGGGGVV